MVRGRKPNPTEINRANGAYKKNPNRENLGEPKPDKDLPQMPEHIASDETARQVWKELELLLVNMNVQAKTDVFLMSLLVINETAVRKWTQKWLSGLMDKDESVQYRYACDKVAKLGPEFGFSPASRPRIKVNKDEEENLMEALNAEMGVS